MQTTITTITTTTSKIKSEITFTGVSYPCGVGPYVQINESFTIEKFMMPTES